MTDNSEHDIANPDDFFVVRDDDDNVQPVEQKLPGVEEHIRVVPMTMGDINSYGGEQEIAAGNLEPEQVAEIFNAHLADLERDVTGEDVEENLIGFGSEAVLTAILRASGYDMQQSLNMENLEMLQQIDDPGKLEALMDFAEEKSS